MTLPPALLYTSTTPSAPTGTVTRFGIASPGERLQLVDVEVRRLGTRRWCAATRSSSRCRRGR